MTLQVLCLHLLGKTLFPKVSQVCDKCDGKHPTEKCPFFPLERSRHKDAWVRETQLFVDFRWDTFFFATISPTSRWITDAKILYNGRKWRWLCLRSLGANYWCSAILSIVKNCRATEQNIVESLKIEFNKKNWSRNRFEITSHLGHILIKLSENIYWNRPFGTYLRDPMGRNSFHL